MSRFVSIVTLATLLTACTPAPSVPDQVSRSSPVALVTIQQLDELAATVDATASKLRVVDLGRTLAADRLRGFYDGTSLRKIEALYDGVTTQTSVLIYIAQVEEPPTALLIETISTASRPNRSLRLYLAHNTVAAKDEGAATTRNATAAEMRDAMQFYQEFTKTLNRAAVGVYDDPAAFRQE